MGLLGGLAGGALAVGKYAGDKLGQIRDDELIRMKEQVEIAREQRIQEAARQNRIEDFNFQNDPVQQGIITRNALNKKKAEDEYKYANQAKEASYRGAIAKAEAKPEPAYKRDVALAGAEKDLSIAEVNRKKVNTWGQPTDEEQASIDVKKAQTEKLQEERKQLLKGLSPQVKSQVEIFQKKADKLQEDLNVNGIYDDDPVLRTKKVIEYNELNTAINKLLGQSNESSNIDDDPIKLRTKETIKPNALTDGESALRANDTEEEKTGLIAKKIPARTRAGTPVKDTNLSETVDSATNSLNDLLGVKSLSKSQKAWLQSLKDAGKFDEYQRLPAKERIRLLSEH